MNYTDLDSIQIYKIKFSEHQNNYDFYSSEELIDEFVKNVRVRFLFQQKNLIIKSGFSIQNIHPSHSLNLTSILDKRYWSTGPCQTKSFNDFVCYSLKQNIERRILHNSLSESSRYFKKFNILDLKVFIGSDHIILVMAIFIDFEARDEDNQNDKQEMEEVSNSDDSFIDDEPECEDVYCLGLRGITRNCDDVLENFLNEDVTNNSNLIAKCYNSRFQRINIVLITILLSFLK